MRRLGLALAAAVALALPGDAWAPLQLVEVRITPTGPVPQAVSLKAGLAAVLFTNEDSQPHTIVFADGRTCATVRPGVHAFTGCSFPRSGRFSYHATGQEATGVVIVALADRSVTIRASRRIVVFGQAVALSGTLFLESYPPFAGEGGHVDVLAGHRLVARVTTHAPGRLLTQKGRWSLRVRPGLATAYRARASDDPRRWRAAESGPATVLVRPRVTLAYNAGSFVVTAAAGRSLAGRVIVLQRRDGGAWRPVGRLVLGRKARPLRPRAPAVFRAYLPHPGPGLLPGASAPLSVSA